MHIIIIVTCKNTIRALGKEESGSPANQTKPPDDPCIHPPRYWKGMYCLMQIEGNNPKEVHMKLEYYSR